MIVVKTVTNHVLVETQCVITSLFVKIPEFTEAPSQAYIYTSATNVVHQKQ